MTRDEAIIVLKNAAWLGSDAERDRTEQAIGIAVEALQADAVPVVRCKDCKHYIPMFPNMSRGACEKQNLNAPYADDYCSDGARKDGKDDAR